MLIGVPKEIQDNERRVSLTPEGTESLVAAGHKVLLAAPTGRAARRLDRSWLRDHRRRLQ